MGKSNGSHRYFFLDFYRAMRMQMHEQRIIVSRLNVDQRRLHVAGVPVITAFLEKMSADPLLPRHNSCRLHRTRTGGGDEG
jgi:hypothetical protein